MAISIIIGILIIVLISIWFIYRNYKRSQIYKFNYCFKNNIKRDPGFLVYLAGFILHLSVQVGIYIGSLRLLTKFYLVLTDYGIKSLGQNLYVVRVSFEYWRDLSIVISVMLSVAVTDTLIKIIFRENYEDVCKRYIVREPCGGKVAEEIGLIILAGIICIVSITAFILGINNYTRFTNDGIIINKYISFHEEVYNYSQVDKIVLYDKVIDYNDDEYPDGQVKYDLNLVIIFKDGYSWEPNDIQYENCYKNDEYYRKIANFVSKKTGKKVVNGGVYEYLE